MVDDNEYDRNGLRLNELHLVDSLARFVEQKNEMYSVLDPNIQPISTVGIRRCAHITQRERVRAVGVMPVPVLWE